MSMTSLYSFYEDDLWTLAVQFDILPNDEALPVEVGDASDPGGAQEDRIDPDKPAAPAANGTNDALGFPWSARGQEHIRSRVIC